LTLGELAAAEQVKPPTMTRLVRALEARGLVNREADERDGRVVRLSATAKGRKLLAEGRARRVQRLANQIAQFAAAERATLEGATDLLAQITAGLDTDR
jgi:DNA-binding MarR family transcriptional regulator